MFMFRFNLFVVRNDEAMTYAMNETCSPSLPWSPREVTCEANYMEVRVPDLPSDLFLNHWLVWCSQVNIRSEVTCSSGTRKNDWNTLKTVLYVLKLHRGICAVPVLLKPVLLKAHSSTTSDWQVMFQQGETKHLPMTLSEASMQGYTFYVTDGRLVFRTPYGQPHSLYSEVSVPT